MPLFLLSFIPTAAAFFALWVASLYLDAQANYRERLTLTTEAVRHGRERFQETLMAYAADLQILAKNPRVRRLASGDPTTREGVNEDFATFISAKPVVRQLRYLDRNGNEVARVDRRGDHLKVTAPADLQNKADRYYFKDSIGLPLGAIYISRIDLNVERGQIETPWDPMLRIATPIPDSHGEVAGILIVNISVGELIAAVQGDAAAGYGRIQLLNEQGFWMAGVDNSRLWGFMFGADASMPKDEPEIWRQISKQLSGRFNSGASSYVFRSLQPANALESTSKAVALPPTAPRWILLGVVPSVTFASLWSIASVTTAIIGLLLIGGICFFWSRSSLGRRDAEAKKSAAEAQLMRMERLASLGGLVAGVAHELNTPIGNAVTVASTLASQVSEFGQLIEAAQIRRSDLTRVATDMSEGMGIILRGLERASTLIGHFKQVAVDQTSEQRRSFALADLVSDVVGSIRPQFNNLQVRLGTAIASRHLLQSYPGPLGQVLLNLIDNARLHAFEPGQSGLIMLTATDVADSEVEIVVSDTGKGIPPEIRAKIFEPFFTTRLGQGGSGLGLSIVFNIVTGILEGTIHVESTLGVGTSVIVRLPRVTASHASEQFGSVFGADYRKRA